jgi:hypothetical protein
MVRLWVFLVPAFLLVANDLAFATQEPKVGWVPPRPTPRGKRAPPPVYRRTASDSGSTRRLLFSLGYGFSNYSNAQPVGALQLGSKGVFHLGAEFEMPLPGVPQRQIGFFIVPGLRFAQKGQSLSLTSTVATIDGAMVNSYLEESVFVKVKPVNHSEITPYAAAGFRLGELLSSSKNITSTVIAVNNTSSSNMSSIDFSIGAQVGAEYRLPNAITLLGYLGYDLGLVNVSTDGGDSKSRLFTFGVGMAYAL